MTTMRHLMQKCVEETAEAICAGLTAINGQGSISHPWSSPSIGGGGVANVFLGGRFLEKGGVNVSTVHGPVFGEMVKMLSLDQQHHFTDYTYFATGISLVLHPLSPFVPTVHANYRYFEIEDKHRQPVAWFFGGGADLTPYYLFEEDAVHFHQIHKEACDHTDSALYQTLKRQADAYFYLPHRKEHRGIGGIFSLKSFDRTADAYYHWAKYCANAFLPSYCPIVEKRMHLPYEESHKKWQLIRRGRYVEFNLLYDLGTSFGLKSGGHTENILISLPPQVSWEYNFQPKENSEEARLLDVIQNPREWI